MPAVRPAAGADRTALWRIIGPTLHAGETYALPRDISEADALAYWCAPTSAAAAPMSPIAAT